jgi:hypothetical protein
MDLTPQACSLAGSTSCASTEPHNLHSPKLVWTLIRSIAYTSPVKSPYRTERKKDETQGR